MGSQIRFSGDGMKPFSLMLERFENNVRDAEPMFQALADAFGAANRNQFAKAGAHYGTPWAPLSPAYAAWKAKNYPGRPLMVLDGTLRESLTQRPFGVDEVHATGMVVGTGVDHARYHQDGTATMPARPLIGNPTAYDKRRYGKALHSWVVKGLVDVGS